MITLDHLLINDKAVIVNVNFDSCHKRRLGHKLKGDCRRQDVSRHQYRKKLLEMGLTKGTVFTLIHIAPLGDPITISIRGFNLILRKKEAQMLEVEKIES